MWRLQALTEPSVITPPPKKRSVRRMWPSLRLRARTAGAWFAHDQLGGATADVDDEVGPARDRHRAHGAQVDQPGPPPCLRRSPPLCGPHRGPCAGTGPDCRPPAPRWWPPLPRRRRGRRRCGGTPPARRRPSRRRRASAASCRRRRLPRRTGTRSRARISGGPPGTGPGDHHVHRVGAYVDSGQRPRPRHRRASLTPNFPSRNLSLLPSPR